MARREAIRSREHLEMSRNRDELISAPSSADVAVLTILPESYEAVCHIFELTGYERRTGYQWTWGTLPLRDGGSIVVVTGLPLDRENVAAATFTDAMLEAWHPRTLLLVDIGGAVKGRDNVRVGDVVTHTMLHYYDFHKVTEDGEESPRYLPIAGASTRLRELSRAPSQRGDDTWIKSIFVKRPGAGMPKVLPGEMLVGGGIQSNSPRLLKLLDAYPKVLAVEMEGVGAGRAVLDRSTRGTVPEFLVIRGMSDYCNVPQERNQRTRDRWRKYAAAAAAAHAFALVREMDALPGPSTEGPHPQPRIAPTWPVDNLWKATQTVLRGREQEIQELKRRFSPESNVGEIRHPHVIWGEAGVGKSVLAREVVEAVAPYYAVRWWIDASDQLKIRVGLRQLARCLGIPSAEMDLNTDNQADVEIHRFLSDLREVLESRMLNGRALIVLDNVDDARLKHDLKITTLRYLPTSACDVLITSQSNRWHGVAPTETPLKGLDPTTGARLIADESGRPELIGNEDIETICRYFDGRPLFLKQIASLLRDGDNPADFRRLLYESTEDALEILPEIEGFDPLWRRTYGLSIARADSARPGARKLLETMAFFSPERVPVGLLHATAELRRGSKPAHIDAALRTVTERSLLQCQRQQGSGVRSYTMHRVVGALVRTMVRESGHLSDALSAAASAIYCVVPRRDLIRRPEGLQTMTVLAPHMEAVTDFVLEHRHRGVAVPLPTSEKAAEISSILGLHRRTLSEWAAAEDASQKAVDLSDPVREPGNAALRKVRLANVMRQRAQFGPAQDLLNDALPTLKKHGDRREYAWALTVQARILRHRPDSAPVEALAMLEQAMQLLKSFDDSEEPTIRRQLSELHGYLSVVSRQLSKLDVAESESAEGLRMITGGMLPDEVLEASELPDEPLLATHLRALGGVWRLTGDLSRAMHAHQRALEIFERVYGPNHTDVCRALDSLGRVQREWGDLDGALASFTRAEEISDIQFGPNSPHAATAIVNRALVYLEMGESLKALEAAEKGLRIYRFVYNEAHNDEIGRPLRNEATVWALFVRANALADVGRLKRAYDDHTAVLNWRKAHYPALHALVASSHYALGDVLWAMGSDDARNRALNHHRQALVIREQVFGREANYWVAQSQSRLGSLTNDRELLRLAYETYTTQLMPGHWRTREVAAVLERLNSHTPLL